MGSRYYNPRVGRFITQDTYGAAFGADWTDHLYSYTNNSPVNMVDPTGHENLRDLVSRIGGSISYDAKKKAATVVIYRNGEYHNYTFRQSDWHTVGGRIQISQAAFNDIISKPGTVYGSKSTLNLGPISTAINITKGSIGNPAVKDALKLADRKVTTIDVVSGIADEVNNNPKQSIEKSIIKGGIKTGGHAAVGKVQGDLIAGNWTLHVGAALEAPPVAPVMAISASGITWEIIQVGKYLNKGWDWLVDKIVR